MIKNIIIFTLTVFLCVSGYAYYHLNNACNIQSTRIVNIFKELEKYQTKANEAEIALIKCKNEKKEIKDIKFKPAACSRYECGNPNTIARRFNNPFNIKRKYGGGKWQGEIGHDKQGHVHFSNIEYGIRAAAFTLRSYYKKHKINTLEDIINRFCGGNKNYVSFLSKRMKLKPNEKFNILNRMSELLRHMSKYESGKELPKKYLVTLDVLENL